MTRGLNHSVLWLTLTLACAPNWSKEGPGFVDEANPETSDTGDDSDSGDSSPGDSTPAFEISAVPDGDLAPFQEFFDKYTSVFGVHIFATNGVPDAKLLHCAHVLAQYLDNDEDGVADDAAVVEAMTSLSASMVMFGTERELETSGIFESDIVEDIAGQDLLADETFPEGSVAAGRFDATLEEVLHLVTVAGVAEVYPDTFGYWAGSQIAEAMDLARGGHFESIPSDYPAEAWYHYDDSTCEYECMVVEYYYWVQTSLLGAQDYPGRCDEISNEWEACTAAQVESMDPAAHALFTDTQYNLPTVLPDGTYDPQ